MSLSFSKIKHNAKLNLQLSLWVALAFASATALVAGLIMVLKYFSVLKSLPLSQLALAQLLTIINHGLIIGSLVILPLLLFKKPAEHHLTFQPKQLGFTGWLKWRDIGLAIAAFVLGFVLRVAVILMAEQLFPGFKVDQKQELGFTLSWLTPKWEIWLTFAVIVVFVPIVEELVFRGYLYGKMRAHSSFVTTMLINSALFGLAHYAGGGWVTVLATGSLAVVMCLSREVSGSIYPSILIHMMNNGLALVVLLNSPMLFN